MTYSQLVNPPQQGPAIYLSSTHGPIEIYKMDTQHLKNAICKKFRGVFNPLPKPYREVIYILLKNCSNSLPPNRLSEMVSVSCQVLEWEDREMFDLLMEMYHRTDPQKTVEI